jgi:hypothetical protein
MSKMPDVSLMGHHRHQGVTGMGKSRPASVKAEHERNRGRSSCVLNVLAFCAAALPACGKAPHGETSGPTPAPSKALKLVAVGKASCAQPLIDDVETEDVTIPTTDRRGGFWYTFKDGSGTTLEPDGPYTHAKTGAHGSKGSAHIAGRVAEKGTVYAGLAMHLTGTQLPYDLSPAAGICFWAKGHGVARVSISDINTAPEGGVCKVCYNSFGKTFELSADWEEYCFKFNRFTQSPGWGDRFDALAADAAFGIQWVVARPATDYDLWLDDVRLMCE